MAELDDKLIQNLNQRLQTMETLLSNLTKTLGGVKEGMVSAFNPEIVKSWSDSIKGLKTVRLIDAEKAKTDIKEINDMVRVLTQEYKHGRVFTPFSEEEKNATIARLASIRVEIENLNRKAKSKAGLTEDDALRRESLRQQRDELYMETRRGGTLGAFLSPQELSAINDQLAKYKALQTDIAKGSERRAAELANLKRTEEQNALKQELQLNKEIAAEEQKRAAEARQRYAEAQAANKALNKEQDALEKRQRSTRVAESKSAWRADVQKQVQNEQKMNQAIQQQIQYYRQLHTLYKGYKDLQAKPNKTKEDIAILEQTKQKILEILRLSKQLELENRGSRQAGINATNFQRLSDNLRNASKETKTLKANLNNLLPTLQRLASAFGIAFSVRGLAQFGKKLIETRGEFEMQFVAMKQIIGDVDAATKIWNQTMQQALQSPFKAMELVKYTKQLAAYRIETDKLFDTTKRLADVSAGLGVDMQRLILAYGQVKAANFLRASEIRQFTEAGVNILGELSKYFTEIEGRAVSTAQVMERVTKRMVTFADVEEIFKRMTDEGGVFFNMQEVQADTVKGQLNKLHDAYDQMLNTIGKANQGTLRNFIGILNKLVRNWEKVASWLKIAGGLFVTFKVAQIAAAVSMIRTTKAANAEAIGITGLTARLVNLIAVEKNATSSTLTLSTALKQLNSSKGGWIGVAVSAALTAAMAIYDYYQRSTKLSKELNEITSQTQMRARKSTNDYEQMAEKIRDVNTSEKERQETLSKLKRMYEDILPARMLEIEYITKEGNAYDDAKESIKAYYEEKRKQESLDKVYEKYGKDVEEKQSGLVKFFNRVLSEAGYNVQESDISSVVNEMIEQYKRGEIALEDFLSTFDKLIQLQTGIDFKGKPLISEDWLSKNLLLHSNYKDAYFWINRLIHSEEVFNEKLEEVTGSTAEFGSEIKKTLDDNVFKKAGASLQEALGKEKFETFNKELEFNVENYEQYAREAYEAFKTEFEEQYNTNPIYYDDQFEKMIEKRLGEMGIAKDVEENTKKRGKAIENSIIDNQRTVNAKLEELAKNARIGNRELLRQFQLDTSVETSKWIENQLALLERYEQEWSLIQRGLTSDFEKGHIEMLSALQPFIPLWKEFLKPSKPKGGSGGENYKSVSTLISLLKEMNSEYDKLSKSAYGFAKSQEKVNEAYSDTFKEVFGFVGLDINQVDFTDKAGVAAAMELVMKKLEGKWGQFGKDGGKKAKQEFMKEFSKFTAEVDIEASVKLRKDFGKQIEEMFSNYDLTIDLEKLNVPTDELVGIFNLDVTTLEELRKVVDDFYYAQKSIGADPTELVEQVEGYHKKIDEMEKKELRERLKTYSKYLAEGQNEALKIHLEELKKMAELDELYEQGYFTDTQYKDISNKIRKKTGEELAKNDWEQFKQSDFYVTMFEDMSRVSSESIDIMIERLKSLRKSVNDLNPKQAKEIVKAIEKLEKAKLERSPLKSFLEDWKAAAKWRKDNDNLVKQLGFYASGEEYWSKEQDKQSKRVAELRLEYEELVKNGTPEDAADVKNRLDFEEEELSRINEILEDRRQKLDQINQEQNEGYAAQQRVLAGLAQGAQYFSDLASTAGTISTEIMDMFDGVSDATKKYAKDIAEIATNAGMLAADIAKAIASEGTDVGSMIDGIVRTWNIIKGALSASEREINETIEKSTNALKDLEVQLDRVTKAREKAWDTQTYTLAQRELENNIQEQIKAYDAMIAAEEDRKSRDKEQLRTWKQERDELIEQLKDEKETLLKEFGGIGESEYKNAAQGFVDAWKSAFLETGDGLQGLQDHFDEFLNEWFVKQATMRVAGKMLEPLFRDIDDAVDKYGDGGTSVMMSELAKVRERFGIIAPQLSDTLEELSGLWGLGGEGGLSGLAAGIQGMTEEQANILEDYWNSVKGYTANIDMNVSRIAQILGAGGDNTNPMLAQMTLVAQNTTSINRLLDSVVQVGHPMGRSGIKVFSN